MREGKIGLIDRFWSFHLPVNERVAFGVIRSVSSPHFTTNLHGTKRPQTCLSTSLITLLKNSGSSFIKISIFSTILCILSASVSSVSIAPTISSSSSIKPPHFLAYFAFITLSKSIAVFCTASSICVTIDLAMNSIAIAITDAAKAVWRAGSEVRSVKVT